MGVSFALGFAGAQVRGNGLYDSSGGGTQYVIKYNGE